MAFPKTARTIAAGLAVVGITAASIAYGTTTANAASSAPTLVDTELGALQGSADDGIRSWLGVPYAAAPEGDLRWESPEPATAWDGTRAATEFASSCAQGQGQMPSVPSTDEDCLYLNVYAPDTTAKDLPVMVWFHGGGNTYGAGEQYDPARLVEDGQAVVVTVNYRLGLYGNMAHPALDEDGAITSGNYGLEDQQAALAWLRDNASAFGGDEDNFTIFGESGGGYDVCAHLASESSEDLFDKAIIQSAPCSAEWAPTREEGQARDIAATEPLCPDEGSLEAVEDCLRALTPQQLNDAALGLFEIQPVVGGPVMAVSTGEAVAEGDVNDADVLIGINRDEEQGMVAGQEIYGGGPITPETYAAMLDAAFGENADAVAAEYPLSDYATPALALSAVQTDANWAAPLGTTLEGLSGENDTYAYELAATDTPWYVGFPRPEWATGSYHMAEIAYLFDTDILEPLSAQHEALADSMVKAWTTFARTGDPDARGRWTETDGVCGIRAFDEDGITRTDFTEGHHLEFWAGLNA